MSDDTPTPNQALLKLNITKAVHPSQGISADNVDFVMNTIRPIVLPDP